MTVAISSETYKILSKIRFHARRTDPDTAVQAIAGNDPVRLVRVYQAVLNSGRKGTTMQDLEGEVPHRLENYSNCFKKLVEAGFIRDSGWRSRGEKTDRLRIIWVAVGLKFDPRQIGIVRGQKQKRKVRKSDMRLAMELSVAVKSGRPRIARRLADRILRRFGRVEATRH